MAGDLHSFALEKAELLSSRLKELVSSGQGYVQAQFGVNLGLKPELYPSWVILSTTAVGVLLLLGISWAVVCGGLSVGKKRGSPVNKGREEPGKADFNKSVKPEEPKKRSKKKTVEKKTQSNGQPVVVAREEVKETEAVSKVSPQIKAGKVHEVQAPVQVKKNKKKTKPDVKPAQQSSTNHGKEPDDGAWETKVSNREKRQQRRKEKGSEDSGSSGGAEAPKTHVEAPAATPTSKKNRGNHESQHSRTTTKGDAASGAGKACSTWKEEAKVNGGGWSDVSTKVTGQMGPVEGKKWSTIPAAAHYRPQSDPQPWAQEPQAAWSGGNGPMKTVSFPVLGLNTMDSLSNSSSLQWTKHPDVDDGWSGLTADPGSDWNAPLEHWGNYEEPPVLVAAASVQKDRAVPNKVSEDEQDVEDPSGGAAKSKKRRKKKKKTEEESTSDSQMQSTAPVVSAATKTQELSMPPSNFKSTMVPSSQKKSEQPVEPQKPSQKKVVRRES